MPGIGLGVGIGRHRFYGDFAGAYSGRVIADGGVVESISCVASASTLLQSASLLLIPSGYKAGKLYAENPTNGNGDLNWTRNSVANRTNSSGLISSVAIDTPRLSYMYGSCPAVLLEPQRTNLALQSESFDNASWTKSASTITANNTTAPNGTLTADVLIENTATTTHQIFQSITSGIVGSNANTATLYVQQYLSSSRNIGIRIQDNAFTYGQVIAVFNPSTGALITSSTAINGVILSTSSTLVNGFYRIQVTFTIASSTAFRYDVILYNGTSNSYTGDGTSGVTIWGAQLEAGAYPTTYIQTPTSASATRVADSFSRNNIYTNGLITSSGGTWFVELRGNVALLADTTDGLWLGTSSNVPLSNGTIFFRQGGGSQRVGIWKYIGGASSAIYSTTTETVKLAIKWNGTTADIFENGTKVVSATSFAHTDMEFLYSRSGRPTFIQQMALFNTPLTDTQCQTLTT